MGAVGAVGYLAAAAAVAGTTASIENSNQSRRLAGQAKDRMQAGETQARGQAQAKEAQDAQAAANDAARIRQRGVTSDRAGTILTGPLGQGANVTTLGGVPGKTVLGG